MGAFKLCADLVGREGESQLTRAVEILGLVLGSLCFHIFVGCTHCMGGILCHLDSPEKVRRSEDLENNLVCWMLHCSANLSVGCSALAKRCLMDVMSLSGEHDAD